MNVVTDDRVDGERLIRTATDWARGDVDPITQTALMQSIEKGDVEEIRRACVRPLEFGTAGLRGEVGPGPARMNLATISKVSYAIGEFLSGRGAVSPVVVGFDARADSPRFARHCAEVLGGLGVDVLLAGGPLATPLIAYAVRKLEASAGVVVTASHNPREDNGFKVFDDRGVQIIAPWDSEIADRMRAAPEARTMARRADRIRELPSRVLEEYFGDAARTAAAHVPGPLLPGAVELAYTPLHGVGLSAVESALKAMAVPIALRSVGSQSVPDGGFPTVPFPNPEEPGALDLLIEEAEGAGLASACANDPDADRFAVCLPLGSSRLVRLSGDALGLLFADACLKASRHRRPVVVSTVVSSPALEALVEEHDGRLIRSLTGFKWICHAAAEEEQFVFAYEEALGYCFAAPAGSMAALDKDGILALLVFARLLAREGGGGALAERLLGLYRRLGLWGSFGHSRRWVGPEGGLEMAAALDRIRRAPPVRVAGFQVVGLKDYSQGASERPWYLGAQDLLQLELETPSGRLDPLLRGRVLIRPSGTEPKLKAYVHLCSEFGAAGDFLSLNEQQSRLAGEIASELLGEDA